MNTSLNHFLWGALAMGSAIAGLFFLRYWRNSRDRLFLFFCGAFWFLAANWIGLATVHPSIETRHQVYVLRLLAFGLIIAGNVDKNRRIVAATPSLPATASETEKTDMARR
jgi:hypothetical protein